MSETIVIRRRSERANWWSPLVRVTIGAALIGLLTGAACVTRAALQPSTVSNVRYARLGTIEGPPPVVDTRLPGKAAPPQTAQLINAARPFATTANPPARPFRFAGGAIDEEKALTCLAAAGWYEAGDDVTGEQAVMQVVLNRVRHPAFPKTVCGVVFQNNGPGTTCQFTFTCDGALDRRPSPAAWQRARILAAIALRGAVYGLVGTATHYHADGVVPSWAGLLDKSAKVGAHIFYRWRGGWGAPAIFARRQAGDEQLDPRLDWLSALSGSTVDATSRRMPVNAVLPGLSNAL